MWISPAVVTLPTGETLSGKNVRTFLVCGFLMKSLKKYPENMKKKCRSRLEINI